MNTHDETRLVLVGAVESSYAALEELALAGANVVEVFTLAPEYAHRHSDFVDLRPLAQRFNIPVSGIRNINEPAIIARLESIAPDYLFVIGWSQIIGQALLDLPKFGCVGFHPALLPKNRGRAVIPWTILRRLPHAGATLFFLDEGIDSGNIIAQRAFDVVEDETARSLYDKVILSLRDMIRQIAPLLPGGQLPRTPQDHSQATYCAKRTPKDGLIDWQRSGHEIWTLIRAVSDPYPGAFTFHKKQKLTIWKADLVRESNHCGVPGQVLTVDESGALVQCGEGCIRVLEVQPEGGEVQPAAVYFTKVHEVLGLSILDVLPRD